MEKFFNKFEPESLLCEIVSERKQNQAVHWEGRSRTVYECDVGEYPVFPQQRKCPECIAQNQKIQLYFE